MPTFKRFIASCVLLAIGCLLSFSCGGSGGGGTTLDKHITIVFVNDLPFAATFTMDEYPSLSWMVASKSQLSVPSFELKIQDGKTATWTFNARGPGAIGPNAGSYVWTQTEGENNSKLQVTANADYTWSFVAQT